MANWTEHQKPINAEQRLAAWNLSHTADWQVSLKRLRDAGFREAECASILGVTVEELWAERAKTRTPERPAGPKWTVEGIRQQIKAGVSVKHLCRVTGIPEGTAYYRMLTMGWTLEDAVTKPQMPRKQSGKLSAAARRKSLERNRASL